MPDVVTNQLVTVPANTLASAYVVQGMRLGDSNVTHFRIVFPPGCSGLVGARVQYAGTPLYPNSLSTWYIVDDYVVEEDVTGQRTGGTWELAVYNTDLYPHNLQWYMSWDYLPFQPSGSAPSVPVSL